jgi:hypothetical protein
MRPIHQLSRATISVVWLACLGAVAFWHLTVKPHRDGNEGSGTGFGFYLIHVVIPIFSVAVTATTMLFDWIVQSLKRHLSQEAHLK